MKTIIDFRVFLIVIFVVILLASCDEDDKITNPESDYLIEKTIQASSEEQIIESGSEFKMIFPANSISGNLEVKVKKESSAPALNIPNQKPGKNFFKIKFSGETAFLHPVKLIINYDKSAIPTGKTAQESVFGYIYSSGSWKLADYQLDEANEKIIISISSILGKTYKDEPILLDDVETIIGDAYTTTDEGQSDELLERLKYFNCQLLLDDITIIKQSDGLEYPYEADDIKSNSGWEVGIGAVDSVFVKWQGNKFTIIHQAVNEVFDVGFNISGQVDKSTWNVSNLIFEYSRVERYTGGSCEKDILIHFNVIKGRYFDFGGLGQMIELAIDSKANDNPSNHDQDLNKIIRDISYTERWYKATILQDVFTLKSINDLAKNRFSLDLGNQPKY
ncbi:MAG: hypothetical protein M9949_01390 [Candidatus Kapabacteria bacterium]|nr:hypothetical protein [Candidatus Kapabacteria bacterium]